MRKDAATAADHDLATETTVSLVAQPASTMAAQRWTQLKFFAAVLSKQRVKIHNGMGQHSVREDFQALSW